MQGAGLRCLVLRVYILGAGFSRFRVPGFGVSGSEFRGVRFRVRVLDFGFRGFGFWDSVQISDWKKQSWRQRRWFRFRVPGFRFRIPGPRFRVQGQCLQGVVMVRVSGAGFRL